MRLIHKDSYTLELIKWISIVTMLMDHVGMIFYNEYDTFRFIGRFAYIGFSFLLAYNYRYNTKSKFNYKKRLLIWAILSQFIFNYVAPGEMNILFLLLMGIYSIDALEEIKNYKVLYPTFILSSALIVSLFSGYFLFGLLVIIFFYYSLEEIKYFIPLLLSIALLNFSMFYGVAAILSFILIYMIHTSIKIKRLKSYVFYAFYPMHLLILALIKNLL